MTEDEIKKEIEAVIERGPQPLTKREYRFDSFDDGNILLGKKKGHLPAMGWNSWNAFGTGNTEELTKAMADSLVRLSLDRLGYRYVVLDDGCYYKERVNGKLTNEPEKFPDDFKTIADYIHARGLKFGMYNDIGTNLCGGAYVGTCGHEAEDAESYAAWDVDFLKVDNCYYLWDNATFSDSRNAKYVFAPSIRSITVSGNEFSVSLSAAKDGILSGERICKKETYVTDIGTFDGTGPGPSPLGNRSGELQFSVTVPKDGEYTLAIDYATSQEEGQGEWLQVAVGSNPETLSYDGFVPATPVKTEFCVFDGIRVTLKAGENRIRLMNHRRQENTFCSYATLLDELNRVKPGHDILLSLCEWGKTHPQNWGYRIADSWRILNDITFRVGRDGDPGVGTWKDPYTPSVTSQYNKAVVMDEFAGLDRGWNDPDMLMIGMNGLTDTQYRTHMAMWCMMNAPLMLGLDLRRVEVGDSIWTIIANEALIALNQDPLGVQAKRLVCSIPGKYEPDRTYITNIDRVDILAKPLSDGGVAISFINVSEEKKCGPFRLEKDLICRKLAEKMVGAEAFANAAGYTVTDLWSGEQTDNTTGIFEVTELQACESVTWKVMPYGA